MKEQLLYHKTAIYVSIHLKLIGFFIHFFFFEFMIFDK